MNLLLLYLQHLTPNLKKYSLSSGEAIRQAYGKPNGSKINLEFKQEHMAKSLIISTCAMVQNLREGIPSVPMEVKGKVLHHTFHNSF